MTELEEVENRANLRLAIVCSLWAGFFIIPVFFFVNTKYLEYALYSWYMIVIIGILISPYLCLKIWKNI